MRIATVALMLNFGVASVYAQQTSVTMTFSGTAGASAINLLPGTSTDEYNLAGNGTLGAYTFRTVSVNTPSSPPSTCSGSTHLYFSTVAGGGVFRFQDGSLLKAHLTHGSDCIDLVANQALCIRVFQITGGTGRFQHASGTVTFTETLVPVLADPSGNPVFFTSTGEATGTVSGVTIGDEQQNEQH